MGIATALPTESRRAERRGLFMSAQLLVDGQDWPIRVRNISETGAMVEGMRLPETGAVELRRADHRIVASIAWAQGKRRGLRFHRSIEVAEWLPSTDMQGQQLLDARIAAARAQAVPQSETYEDDLPIVPRVGEELKLASRRLEGLLDTFGDYMPMLQRFPTEMQQLEVLQQLLEWLGNIIQADDPVAAAARLGMDDVKHRLQR